MATKATATETDDVDLTEMSERELLLLSQRIKRDVIEPARKQRQAIVVELGRRSTERGLKAKLGELNESERDLLRRELAAKE